MIFFLSVQVHFFWSSLHFFSFWFFLLLLAAIALGLHDSCIYKGKNSFWWSSRANLVLYWWNWFFFCPLTIIISIIIITIDIDLENCVFVCMCENCCFFWCFVSNVVRNFFSKNENCTKKRVCRAIKWLYMIECHCLCVCVCALVFENQLNFNQI